MQLARRGVTFIHPDPRLVALSPDGRALEFSSDTARTADAIRAFSPKDAERYPEFASTMARLGGFLSGLLEITPPSLSAPATGELWDLLKLGRRFRALGQKDGYRLLRWGPMAVARSRRRVVRDRPAPGRHCGARDFRHGAGTVVRRDRYGPPPQRGDRSGPRRQQRHDQGRPGCADGRDGAGGARRGRRRSAPAPRWRVSASATDAPRA